MNISSAQPIYSITSSDTITIDLSSISSSSDTITLTSSDASHTIGGVGAGYSYNYTSGAGGIGITAQPIASIDPSIFTWQSPEEFIDTFPDFDRIQKMCEMYPGLKIAYERFVTTYRLVKDDYDSPPEKRIKP